jgi:hypothetical protein
MRDDDGTRWMTAERLIELLSRIQPESRVAVNWVNNLLAMTDDGRPIAYIDFGTESLCRYDDTEETT